MSDAARRHRAAHMAALASLHVDQTTDGEAIYRKLRRLERLAGDAATAQCNGTRYNSQPYRNETAWEGFHNWVASEIRRIFGQDVPGAFFNSDPRGYALKIEEQHRPEGMERDWGGYGCLAPEFGKESK